MTQSIERVLNTEGQQVFAVTADVGMSGAAIDVTGIWYSYTQLQQLVDAITRAQAFLVEQGVA